jgi:hypothetical protein
MNPSKRPLENASAWVSRYQDLGQRSAPVVIAPSPYEKAMAAYDREKRRALGTLLGTFTTVVLVFGATFFGLGRWSVPMEDRLLPEPSLPAAEQLAWEAKIANLEAENIDLRLAVRDKEAAIEDLGQLIWSWVEKERRRGLEPEIPFAIGQNIPAPEGTAKTDLASLEGEKKTPRP